METYDKMEVSGGPNFEEAVFRFIAYILLFAGVIWLLKCNSDKIDSLTPKVENKTLNQKA